MLALSFLSITCVVGFQHERADGPMDQMIDHVDYRQGTSIERAGELRPRRPISRTWLVGAVAALALLLTYLGSSYYRNRQATAPQVVVPSVTVSTPLQRDIDMRLGFLGQFSAIDRVELRAQVGGTLTEIHFKDGQIVHKGDLLFVIDPRPYEIKLAAGERPAANRDGTRRAREQPALRAQSLRRNDFATQETVDQRTNEQDASEAAVEDAKARIRDAQLDLEYCRVTAPFTGRIGARQVSIGSLIAGSRAAVSPTTLLATLVSLDPIYLDFRHERIRLPDLFAGTRPTSRSACRQGRHQPE